MCTCAGLEYRLEKQNEAGAVIDLEKSLRQMTTMEFCLVRENSNSNPMHYR